MDAIGGLLDRTWNARSQRRTGQGGSDSLGRYLILDEIFRDEWVVVHRAYETLTNGRTREVALKRLSSRYQQSDVSFDSILKLAALNHPNIVSISDHGRTSKTCFVATEYVQGHSLRELMDLSSKGEAPPIRVVLLLLRQLCDAINYFRRSDKEGVGHLNLDPATLILRNDGLLQITDTVGSFLSLRDEAPADFVAVGALAYELLCMRPAPEQWTKATSPSSLNPACPSSLAAIVKKCLAGEFEYAGEVLDALVGVESETSLRPTNEVVAAWHKGLYAVPKPRVVSPPVAVSTALVAAAEPARVIRHKPMARLLSRLTTSAFVPSDDRTAEPRRRMPLPFPATEPRVRFAGGTPAGGTPPVKFKALQQEARRIARGSTSPARSELVSGARSKGSRGTLALAISSVLLLIFG